MRNFEFLSSTKIIFGKNVEDQAGQLCAAYGSKILLHYGGGSIKRTGLYDKIVDSLASAGVEVVELAGVRPNPRVSLVRKGVELCKEHGISFILAVGGGSVIDSAKAIAIGALYDGDIWDFFTGAQTPAKTMPVGVVLTMAAAGSETSKSCVISNEEGRLKRGLNSEIIRPVFALMNPELTFSLPPWETACGIADIMAHAMERYFTPDRNVELTDRLCEGLLKTVINNAAIVMRDPVDYDARAEIMLAGSYAHNDLLSSGRLGDFASHMIEHELSALYDVAHGAGLAVVFPAWMKHVHKNHIERFVQFAVNVWGVDMPFENPENIALEGISRMEKFFKSMGLPITLKDLGVPAGRFEEMAERCMWREGKVGNMSVLSSRDVVDILRLAV